MDNRPIGVFDSGFGGLTVARALIDLLPNEDLVYLGDTGRYPYGSRPLDQVKRFSSQITKWLIDNHNVKMVVVACNTASAAALDDLQSKFEVPIVGVIDPGIRATKVATRNKKVGVIGTVGTIASKAYQKAVIDQRLALDLVACSCPGLVEFVERGETSGQDVYDLVKILLEPVKQGGVDTLLLGCTHYPFLARVISDVVGRDVVLVSSADETAFEVRSILNETGLSTHNYKGVVLKFFSSGDPQWFAKLGSQLLGLEIANVGTVEWDC